MTNTKELKAEIIRKGLTHSEIANLLGMSRMTFHKRLHNVSEFRASEITKLSELLELSDKSAIFFAANVD